MAVDEKLFHFTGESANDRLVITKPDRIGLWFYEFCGHLDNDLPYMLYLKMHNSIEGPVTVNSIVQDWCNIITTINGPTHSHTYLAFDSYYMDSAVR